MINTVSRYFQLSGGFIRNVLVCLQAGACSGTWALVVPLTAALDCRWGMGDGDSVASTSKSSAAWVSRDDGSPSSPQKAAADACVNRYCDRRNWSIISFINDAYEEKRIRVDKLVYRSISLLCPDKREAVKPWNGAMSMWSANDTEGNLTS